MNIKTSELTGAALDWAVGDIEFKRRIAQGSHVKTWVLNEHLKGLHTDLYSTDWLCGGPIIEREEVMFHACHTGGINAYLRRTGYAKPGCSWNGPTHLIAAMRCFVASRLGDEVEVPDELV